MYLFMPLCLSLQSAVYSSLPWTHKSEEELRRNLILEHQILDRLTLLGIATTFDPLPQIIKHSQSDQQGEAVFIYGHLLIRYHFTYSMLYTETQNDKITLIGYQLRNLVPVEAVEKKWNDKEMEWEFFSINT